jgi:hypothetical protein
MKVVIAIGNYDFFFRLKCNFGPPILKKLKFWSLYFKIEVLDAIAMTLPSFFFL